MDEEEMRARARHIIATAPPELKQIMDAIAPYDCAPDCERCNFESWHNSVFGIPKTKEKK